MKSIIDAINELVKGTNIAQSRGAYSFKESHDIYLAIEFINNAIAAQQQSTQQQALTPEVGSTPTNNQE